MILVDSNILLRLVEPGHSQHAIALGAVEQLGESRTLVLVPQNLYEFWAVATRPIEKNGLGRTAEQADGEIDGFLTLFTLMRDERAIFRHWRSLVVDHDVKGLKSHDARFSGRDAEAWRARNLDVQRFRFSALQPHQNPESWRLFQFLTGCAQ